MDLVDTKDVKLEVFEDSDDSSEGTIQWGLEDQNSSEQDRVSEDSIFQTADSSLPTVASDTNEGIIKQEDPIVEYGTVERSLAWSTRATEARGVIAPAQVGPQSPKPFADPASDSIVESQVNAAGLKRARDAEIEDEPDSGTRETGTSEGASSSKKPKKRAMTRKATTSMDPASMEGEVNVQPKKTATRKKKTTATKGRVTSKPKASGKVVYSRKQINAVLKGGTQSFLPRSTIPGVGYVGAFFWPARNPTCGNPQCSDGNCPGKCALPNPNDRFEARMPIVRFLASKAEYLEILSEHGQRKPLALWVRRENNVWELLGQYSFESVSNEFVPADKLWKQVNGGYVDGFGRPLKEGALSKDWKPDVGRKLVTMTFVRFEDPVAAFKAKKRG